MMTQGRNQAARGATGGGIALAALAVAACSTQRAAPPSPRPVATRPAPKPPAFIQSTAQYVAASGSTDLFVVRASELALVRSSDASLRAVATRLAEEHRGLAAQLSMAGRRLDALPTAHLLERDEDSLARLDGEQRFDAAYLHVMASAHARSRAAHARFAASGSSPTLRPVASNAARMEAAHLALLERFGS